MCNNEANVFFLLELVQIMSSSEVAKRTTVTFEDEQYALLEKWADKEVRSVPNLIQAVVVSVLRREPFDPPENVKLSEADDE